MSRQIWLSMDPGQSNYAVTILRYDTETTGCKILYCGMLANPIKNLTTLPVFGPKKKPKNPPPAHEDKTQASFEIGFQLFTDEIEYLLDTYGVTHVVGERFQNRGKFNTGDQSETVSMMLGIVYLLAKQRGAKVMTTIAGVWKQAVKRLGIDLQKTYEYGKLHHKIEPHPIDSTLIGLWHANREKSWPIIRILPKMKLLLQSNELSFSQPPSD